MTGIAILSMLVIYLDDIVKASYILSQTTAPAVIFRRR